MWPPHCTDLGALYVVVQVVPEGVDEVDGVVSGIGIGVTWEQNWKGVTTKHRHEHKVRKPIMLSVQLKKKGRCF